MGEDLGGRDGWDIVARLSQASGGNWFAWTVNALAMEIIGEDLNLLPVKTAVSNRDQATLAAARSVWSDVPATAIRFSTGASTTDWALSSIVLDLEEWADGVTPTVTLREAGTSNTPGAIIATLTNPAQGTGPQRFTAPGATLLAPNTIYTVVVQSDGDDANDFQLRMTASTNEDSDKLTGWSIADGGIGISTNGGSWAAIGTSSDPQLMQVQVLTRDYIAGATAEPDETDADEEGDPTEYGLSLHSRPSENVTVTVGVPDEGEITASPTSLTFTKDNWNARQTVMLTATSDDDDVDETKTVTHSVSSSDGDYDGIEVGDVTVNVTDNDEFPPAVSFEDATYSVTEGGSGTVKVTLTKAAGKEVTVPLSATVGGGATERGETGADYSGVPDNVVFDADDTEKTFSFTATDDTDDDDESVELSFGTLPDGIDSGTNTKTTVNITDNDHPAITVYFGAATYNVNEGSSATVTVNLSADPERTVSIPITKENEDASNSDYSGVPTTLAFGATDTSKTFTFTANHDTLDDDDESVELGFDTANLPDRVTVGSTPNATVSINDDDDPEVTLSFKETSHTVAESDDADTAATREDQVVVTVELSADPERTVEIPITHTGKDGATAQGEAGADYSGVPTSVTFDAGDTEKTFTVTAAGDTVDDDDEHVELGFGAPDPPERVSGASSKTRVNITDDDDPVVTVQFKAVTYTATEGGTIATVTVEISADPERELEIPIKAAGKNGAGAEDFRLSGVLLTFPSGSDADRTFTVTAFDDTVDDDETVELTFGDMPDTRVTASGNTTATVNLVVVDDPFVKVSFQSDA